MTNELKRCGCGGEAIIETDHDTVAPGEPIDWKRVVCHNCNIRTTWRHTEAEAVQAWNRAMGKDKLDELMEHIWRDKLDTREKIVNLVERMLR